MNDLHVSINMMPTDHIITPEDPVYYISMTKDQYEEMIYCIDFVQRGRESAKQRYHDRKERQPKQKLKPKRHQAFPIISQQQQYQQYITRQLATSSVTMQQQPDNTNMQHVSQFTEDINPQQYTYPQIQPVVNTNMLHNSQLTEGSQRSQPLQLVIQRQ